MMDPKRYFLEAESWERKSLVQQSSSNRSSRSTLDHGTLAGRVVLPSGCILYLLAEKSPQAESHFERVR
jgi:hypothetical protein